MSRLLMLVLGAILLAFTGQIGAQGGKEELIENPLYKHWSGFKVGSTVVQVEKTTFSGDEKNALPDGSDQKVITLRLLSVSPKEVVVQTVVTETEFLGTVESAPTKHRYPAKVKKAHVQAVLHELDAKAGEDTVELMGQKVKCKTLEGHSKKDGTQVEYKIWYAESVPGGIVKKTRTTKTEGKTAETVIQVRSYKAAEK